MGAPVFSESVSTQFADGTNTAADLSQFRKGQLSDFLFLFNDLLENLVHLFLHPLRSILLDLTLRRPAFRPISESMSM